MAITKKALRKQAAKARKVAKKAVEKQPNDIFSGQDRTPTPGPALRDALPALEDVDGGATPRPALEDVDDSAAPRLALEDVDDGAAPGPALRDALPDLEDVDGSAAPRPALEDVDDGAAPKEAAPLTTPKKPTDITALEEHAPPPAPASARLASPALETPSIPPLAKPTAPPTLAEPAPPRESAHIATRRPDPAGPSYTRRDPVTGALAEDLEEDLIDYGHSTLVSDEMLAMKLQLEEIRQQTDQKGKFRSDRVPDLQLALATFHAEVNRHIEFLNDVRFANSVANAVHVDGHVIDELAHEEERAEHDRHLAMEMSGEQVNNEPPPNTPARGITIAPIRPAAGITIRALDAEDPPLMVSLAIGQMAALRRKRNAAFEDEDDESEAASSKTYTERQHDAIHKLPRHAYQCTVCTDMFRSHEIVRLDCKHLYCPPCLKKSFILASSDVAYFPPRCCEEIPVSLVSNDMSTQEMEDFTDTAIEVQTTKRTYCSTNQCGKFIPPANIDADFANCTRCGTITCIHCRGKKHSGECLHDEALRSTLALAEHEGWRRCHACQAVVELNLGCYHMTYGLILFTHAINTTNQF
jgi:hypothetical protein